MYRALQKNWQIVPKQTTWNILRQKSIWHVRKSKPLAGDDSFAGEQMFECENEKTGIKYIHVQNKDIKDEYHFSVVLKTPPTPQNLPLILQYLLAFSIRYQYNGEKLSLQQFIELSSWNSTLLNSNDDSSAGQESCLQLSDSFSKFSFKTNQLNDLHNIAKVGLNLLFNANFEEADLYNTLFASGSRSQFESELLDLIRGGYWNASLTLRDKIVQQLFQGTVRDNLRGNYAEVLKTTILQIREYYEAYYHPSNALLFSYGNAEITTMIKLLNESCFDEINKEKKNIFLDHLFKPTNLEHFYKVVEFTSPSFDEQNKTKLFGIGYLNTKERVLEDPLQRHFDSQVLRFLQSSGGPIFKNLDESEFEGTHIDDMFKSDYYTSHRYFGFGFNNMTEKDASFIRKWIEQRLQHLMEQGMSTDLQELFVNSAKLEFRDPSIRTDYLQEQAIQSWLLQSDKIMQRMVHSYKTLFQSTQSPYSKNLSEEYKRVIQENLLETSKCEVTITPSTESAIALENMERNRFEQLKSKIGFYQRMRDQFQTIKYSSAKIELEPLQSNVIKDLPLEYDNHGKQIYFVTDENSTGFIAYTIQIFPKYAYLKQMKSFIPLFCEVINNMGCRDMDGETFGLICEKYSNTKIGLEPIVCYDSQVQKYRYGVSIQVNCLYQHLYKTVDLINALLFENNLKKYDQQEQQKKPQINSEVMDLMDQTVNDMAEESFNAFVNSMEEYAELFASSHINRTALIKDYLFGYSKASYLGSMAQEEESKLLQRAIEVRDMSKGFLETIQRSSLPIKIYATSSSKHKDAVMDSMEDLLGHFSFQKEKEDPFISQLKGNLVDQEKEVFAPQTKQIYIKTPNLNGKYLLAKSFPTTTIDASVKEYAALTVLATLAQQHLNGLLQELHRQTEHVETVSLKQTSYGTFTLLSSCTKPIDIQEMLSTLLQQWREEIDIMGEALEAAKTKTCKNQGLHLIYSSYEKLIQYSTTGMDYSKQQQYRQALSQLNTEDISQVIVKYLHTNDTPISTVVFGPTELEWSPQELANWEVL